MTRLIDSLAEVSASYDALFCDVWGCLHNGIAPFPRAVEALRGFRDQGGRVVLLTNAPRPASEVIAVLDGMGVPRAAWDLVVTSGDAAQAAMLQGAVGRKVWHLGPEKDDRFFTHFPDDLAHLPRVEQVDLDEAEGIVCTGLLDDANEKPEDYRPALLKAKTMGLKLLCANPDIIVDQGDRRLWCAGAIAALYTSMGGESLYFGKPHPPIYDLARARLAGIGHDVTLDRSLAVGDGIATDVQGAVGEGMDVIFITGGIAASETGTEDAPDMERTLTYIESQGFTPTYAMGWLR